VKSPKAPEDTRQPVIVQLREVVAGCGTTKRDVPAVLLPGGALLELKRADGSVVWIPVCACSRLEPA
jgi:hypothetical protein